MSRFAVVFAPAAEADIVDGFCWYRERNGLVADAFRDEVFSAVDRIAEQPFKHPIDGDGNRQRVLRRFPYSVFYDLTGTTVTVLAVAHHRRKPGYWLAAPR